MWRSLAWDFLSVMASSVSSERAFSQAGILITRRRGHLRAKFVEALQCVKVAYQNKLAFGKDMVKLNAVEAALCHSSSSELDSDSDSDIDNDDYSSASSSLEDV